MNSSAFILAIRHPACLYIDPNPRPQYICQWIYVCVYKRERQRNRELEHSNWGVRSVKCMHNFHDNEKTNSIIVLDCVSGVCMFTDR